MARIWVVDDERDHGETMVALLQHHGHEAESLLAGAELCARCDRDDDPPDLILLDLIMPDVDGMTCLTALHTAVALRWRQVPIIVLSAFGDAFLDSIPSESLPAIGVKGVLTKPVVPERLFHAVAVTLG